MSNAQHSYRRSSPLPRRFSTGSLSEAVRVIESYMLTPPISPARIAHIKRSLDGVARFSRSGGL